MSQQVSDRQHIHQVAGVLARSFYHDPLFQYFFPDDNSRERDSYYTFRFILLHALRRGSVVTSSSSLEGAAIFFSYLDLGRGLIDYLRFGGVRMLREQGVGAIRRQIRASDHMAALHQRALTGPHYYLSIIGIEKQHRGKGIASDLMGPMLERADRQQIPCYLDTHNEANLDVYQRFGFQVAHESLIPESQVRHWGMIREKQPVIRTL